ncbi:MAG: helix-turn-helix transcriptional regulator [Methylococcaceae bacterium]
MEENTSTLKDTAWLAKRLGLSVSTIERLRVKGSNDIPLHLTIGNSIRYDEATVNQWLTEQLQTATSKEVDYVA